MHDGVLFPEALVLAHGEQWDRLADAVPEALSRAVVAGDPRFDRMVASEGQRDAYRDALGVARGQRLVVVSSTWWERSLFGTWPDLLRQLMAELPVDRYRVAAVLHPHVWYGHGPAQVRLWLADCLRAGLVLIPPAEGWSAALIASDVVIGDHGAVTGYAAAIDRPVLLAAFPDDDVAEGCAVDVLGEVAPALCRGRPLRTQVKAAMTDHEPGQYQAVADLVTSAPGEAAVRLRSLCYDLLSLSEPAVPVVVPFLPRPEGPVAAPVAMRVTGTVSGEVVHLDRHAADVLRTRPAPDPVLDDAHLVAAADHPVPAIRDNADIVVRPTPQGHAAMTAAPDGNECTVTLRGGQTVRLISRTDGTDPLAAASALYLWRGVHDGLPSELRVHVRPGAPTVFDVHPI